MPHLEFTYFPSQFFWCLLIFLLTYLTVGREFCNKYSKITDIRKSKVDDYINKSNELLKSVVDIEKKIEESKKNLSCEIKKLEEGTKKELLRIKERRLHRARNEIKNKTLSHEIYLNNLKEKIISNLKDDPREIDEKLNFYLFER